MAETADPGEDDVIMEELPGGANEDRLVIAEEDEARVEVDPAMTSGGIPRTCGVAGTVCMSAYLSISAWLAGRSISAFNPSPGPMWLM